MLHSTGLQMGSVDAQPLEGSNYAIFEIYVRITIIFGLEIKLCDIINDISGTTNIRDVKCTFSKAISCLMYIIRLLNGVEELSNASSFFRIGHQGDSLNLTMVQSVYCDQACKELLSCLRRSQVSIDVWNSSSGSRLIQMLSICMAVLH